MKSAYILFAGLFSVYIGQSILGPILPPLVRELGLSEFQGGLIMTFSSVMWVIFSPIWGRRSEVWGRKPVFILSLSGYALGVGAFGLVMQLGLDEVFASSLVIWLLLIAARMIVGTLFSGSLPASQAYVADTTTGQTRTNALGIISAASSLGTIFGPALGGIIVGWGLVAPIFVSAVLPLLGVVLVWLFLPAVKPTITQGQTPPRISPVDPRVWPTLVVGITVTTILALVQFTIGFLFQDRLQLSSQETAQAVSLALVASGTSAVIAQMILIRVFKWSPTTLMRIGLPLLLTAAVLLVLGRNFWVLTLALVFQGFGAGFAFPGYRSAITFAVEPHEQGAAAGIMSSIGGTGFIFGPMLGTGLYGSNPAFPYILGAIVLVVGIMVLVIKPPPHLARQAA